MKLLDDLGTDDFKRFKWYLQGGLEDFKAIPESQLENKDIMDTVDLMVKSYSEDAIKVTKMILEKIKETIGKS